MAVTSKDNPTLTDFIVGMVYGSAPRRKMRDVIRIGQRWRRVRDGIVVYVRNVHRAESGVEVSYEEAVRVSGYEATSWPLSFEALAADYELLVDLGGAR